MSGVSNTRRLRTLIQSARDQHGWTYEEISNRTDRKLSKSLIHKLATETHREGLLPVEQLRALAQGLGMSFTEVRDAALTDLGLMDDEPNVDVLAAIRRDQRLLPEAREHLLKQYGLLLRLGSPAASEDDLRAAMISDIEQAKPDSKGGSLIKGAAKRPK